MAFSQGVPFTVSSSPPPRDPWQVTQHLERRFIGRLVPFTRREEVKQVNAIRPHFDQFSRRAAILVGGEILLAASFRAFNAAANRDGRDGLLPQTDRQIAALEQGVGERKEMET